jgi:environmental stress-induced protein Ves
MQLDIYDSYNQMLRVMHSDAHQERLAETKEAFDEACAERTKLLNHAEGETLSQDDKEAIWMDVKAAERSRNNFEMTSRTKKGDISDFLETRRPFGAAV